MNTRLKRELGRWRFIAEAWATKQYPRITGLNVSIVDVGDGVNVKFSASIYGVGVSLSLHAFASKGEWDAMTDKSFSGK